MKSWCMFAVLCACCAVASAIALPEKAPFNYPPPPVEGKADYFAIAENGQAKCCLVLPRPLKSEEQAAARMLQIYLKLVTGVDFALAAEDTPPAGLGQIHLGETKAAQQFALDLPPARYGKTELPNVNGYVIKTVSPTLLVIRGATPKATIFGAVGLLRRYAGVRRYWPGEPGGIGDVVPRNPSLKLPQTEWRDWPYFISRHMTGLDNRGPQSPNTNFGNFWRIYYTLPSSHSYTVLLKPEEHLNEPALFPLINGKRFVPDKSQEQGWQPCVSNPRVAEIMADAIKQYFRKYPDKFAFNLGVNDGAGDCMCEKCRAMDTPGADPLNRIGLCDRYAKFDNKVAEMVAQEFPNKLLPFIAYGPMQIPPTTVRLHRMLMPVPCVGESAFQMWDDWQKTGTTHMGVYVYHNDWWFIMPKLDIHQSAKRL
ncbi:MAG: DUF4838 domain-containing protein, partial [Verrucomicrobia bacterium]|nr:DUF4838 domain-containing protein [Verrucomicrobiota bacterium]